MIEPEGLATVVSASHPSDSFCELCMCKKNLIRIKFLYQKNALSQGPGLYVCIFVFMQICKYVNVHLCTNVETYLCKYVDMLICTYVYM